MGSTSRCSRGPHKLVKFLSKCSYGGQLMRFCLQLMRHCLLLFMVSCLIEEASSVFVPSPGFALPLISRPQHELAPRSGVITAAGLTSSAKVGLVTTYRRQEYGGVNRLKALLESGPAIPPSQHPAAPLLPTALRSGADVYSHLLNFERKIFLWGPLTEELVASVTAQLLLLYHETIHASKCKQRRVRPNSVPATSQKTGEDKKGEERPFVELVINSRGGSLTAAGEKGERKATPNSRIFLCESAAHAQGSVEELLRQASSLASQEETFERLLSKHTGRQINQISTWRRQSQVFTAEEAKSLGLIDSVVGTDVNAKYSDMLVQM